MGLVLANGKVTGNTARPARILLKGGSYADAVDIEAMLLAYGEGLGLKDKAGRPYGVFVKPHHGGVDVSSALLDHIDVALGGFIRPVTMKVELHRLFDAGAAAYHAFMCGLVRGLTWGASGAQFIHTLADLVRFLHHRLFYTFGVPARLRISPHEPETVTHKVRRSSPDTELEDARGYREHVGTHLAHRLTSRLTG